VSIKYRLVTILAADVVGYTRLMEADELETYETYKRIQHGILAPGVGQSDGRIVKHTGDGFLAIFDNAHQALRCAIQLQEKLFKETVEQVARKRMCFRMALNLADIIVEDQVLLELKTVKALASEHIAQVLNYLKATDLQVGLLINFGNRKLEYRRMNNPAASSGVSLR
jgi:GxxExxY protein